MGFKTIWNLLFTRQSEHFPPKKQFQYLVCTCYNQPRLYLSSKTSRKKAFGILKHAIIFVWDAHLLSRVYNIFLFEKLTLPIRNKVHIFPYATDYQAQQYRKFALTPLVAAYFLLIRGYVMSLALQLHRKRISDCFDPSSSVCGVQICSKNVTRVHNLLHPLQTRYIGPIKVIYFCDFYSWSFYAYDF